MKKLRCAIYTRKSTEEGLEQAFNSLDAQREACEAYILSQAGEGWTALDDRYDDGGWSGGDMNRPALKTLLDDVRAGRVDIIIVYKVDRLTRSLADFARIVDILDAANASFVSVTQAFNTTNSMGRLTLNVLLSFAQFEREVTSERIRDKIAASKAKGMWMGGPVPLGYRLEDRRLVIEASEAETVRMLFKRYCALRSIVRLVDELADKKVLTKARHYKDGRTVGGVRFTRGALSNLLQNPIYLGKVRHRNKLFDGEHDALIDPDLFEHAQRTLTANRHERRNGNTVRYPSLLTGMISDPDGRPMTPVFTSRGSRRHHYYVSRLPPGENSKLAWRIPTGEVDRAVIALVCDLLRTRAGAYGDADAIEQLTEIAASLPEMSVPEQRGLLCDMGIIAILREDAVIVRHGEADKELTHSLPARLLHRCREKRLVLDHSSADRDPDPVLLKLVAQAQSLRTGLFSGSPEPLTADYSKRHRWQLLRIAFLAPDIIAAIVEGRQPPSLNGRRLLRATDLPLDWQSQRRMLGFP